MSMQAVIDRFEGETAVLLVGADQRKMNLPRAELPQGAQEGDWLQVELAADKIQSCRLDEQETAAARQRIAKKLENLRKSKK